MDMATFFLWASVGGGVIVLTCIPLAIIEIRLHRFSKLPSEEPVLSRRQERYRDKFIANQVRITTFGDKRRRSAHVADIIRPQTGPIDLPNAHVEPVE